MRNNPDDLANQILEKVKDMLEINTRVNWDSAEIEPNEEFQNILDEIEKMENQWQSLKSQITIINQNLNPTRKKF